jgi:hypothetical protein
MEDFVQASYQILTFFQAACWPKEQIQMFREFFAELQVHKYRFSKSKLDKKVLLTYQAQQHWKWHDSLNNSEHTFNLALINEELLKETQEITFQEE